MTTPRAVSMPDEERLHKSVEAAQRWLLEDQHPEGFWWGELESNTSITSEYLLLTHHLGIGDPERWAEIAAYLRGKQSAEGYWSQYYEGPGDISTTIETYFALKLAGEDPGAPHMVRAREWILAQGGIAKARVFTKLWLALFGQYDWDRLPVMPAWINLLPTWFPINLYEFASWARATIVGVTVIFATRPVATLPAGAGVQELWRDPSERRQFAVSRPSRQVSWGGFFYGLDKVLRFLDRNHIRPFQRRSLVTAERWLVDRQEADGAWAGIQPPWVYAILALRSLGYPLDHPVIQKALQGFERFTWREKGTLRTESCQSPVWDTGLAAIALLDSGLAADHPALTKSAEWLLQEQVFSGGDWQIKNPHTPPGGWAFEFDNDVYPDVDDTAVVMIALDGIALSDEARKRRAVEEGTRWMLSMQCGDGGWGAFDVENTKQFLTQIPFADFGEVLDPPTADVTAHALEFLGRMGYRGEYPPAARALAFLYALQEPDGSWWGRWGVNYIYGLGAVLPALAELGESMTQPAVRKAVGWLRAHQLPDGGWGESCDSYADPTLAGAGPSTPSQTAWALLALIAAGEAGSEEAARGVRYLIDRQRSDGTWDEPEFTGTGFPGDFMINYHLYRHYFPLMALGRYAHSLRAR
ncbi:MAG: squalene--hopene cyclase [Chloroflexi bacterium]|nr:squalene--hopene cyclase [Chloroflexota bacterium]